MRVLFAGSPEIAVPSLKALAEPSGDVELVGILTNPDSPRGRSGRPEPTAVGKAGEEIAARRFHEGRDVPRLIKVEKLGGEAREQAAALQPDLLVSFAYGRIFGPRFLALFPRGGINIHPSLLPKYRGAAPIQAAILGGDRETGITIQRIGAEMDAGNILLREPFPLGGRETAGELTGIAAQRGADLLGRLFREGLFLSPGEPQNHGEASYCTRIAKDEGRIDWRKSAARIDAEIRAYNPWPLCLTRREGQELYILAGSPYPEEFAGAGLPRGAPPGTVLGTDKTRGILIQTGDGIFAAERLQYRTKKALDWRSFLQGARNFTGSRLE
jgi:methionyl-tRNA formyltransferase